MSKQGEIGQQLVKWKSIQQQIDACEDDMKKDKLKTAEHNCKRTLGHMVKGWNGDVSEIVGGHHG